jgi:hypothetical protein
MADDKIGLEEFLDRLVTELGERLGRQDSEIAILRKELAGLKSGRVRADRSVLKVLRGK